MTVIDEFNKIVRYDEVLSDEEEQSPKELGRNPAREIYKEQFNKNRMQTLNSQF